MEKKRWEKEERIDPALPQPGLREEAAQSQSGPESCLGQGEWMPARKVVENSPLVLQ